MGLVVGYDLVTGQGLGIEFAGRHGVLGALAYLVGVVPLAVGIYLVKKKSIDSEGILIGNCRALRTFFSKCEK